MKHSKLKVSVALFAAIASYSASAQEKPKDTADLKFDNIPGSVSAAGALGIGADDSKIIRTPKDLTILAKMFDSKNAIGISFTPARTTLAPLGLQTYANNLWSRAWANFTIGYAQGQGEVKGSKVNRRAISFDTSYIFENDDPFINYYKEVEQAGEKANHVCYLHSKATPPDSTINSATTTPSPVAVSKEAQAEVDKRAADCRQYVSTLQRWNESKFWASMTTGDYDAVDGSRHSLGNTFVIGGTYSPSSLKLPSAWTLTYTKVRGAPLVDSMILAAPVRENRSLVFGQVAFGKKDIQGVLQLSNAKNESATASTRVYKQALGLDLNVSEGAWVIIRTGRQRKVDNTGDEWASSFSLSISPTSKLKLF